jgi:hypothetical protein
MTTTSHNVDTEEQPHNGVRMFPALRTLERQTPPLKFGRAPYWRAPVVIPAEDVYVPTWNWAPVSDLPDDLPLSILDVNAAYLSAMGQAKIAHSHLIRRGPIPHLPVPSQVWPGYYRITVPYWAFSATIVHPLGNSARIQTDDTLWVPAPSLRLLLELHETSSIGPFDILDCATPDVTTDFKSWATRLKSIRCECIDRIDMAQTQQRQEYERERYDAFKTGYSAALSMMLAGTRSLTHRPDWTHTVIAEHAANTWRKAWRWTSISSLIAMGATDEITVLSDDLAAALSRPRPPFRLDNSGRQPGAFKIKSTTTTGAAEILRPDTLTLLDDEDVL